MIFLNFSGSGANVRTQSEFDALTISDGQTIVLKPGVDFIGTLNITANNVTVKSIGGNTSNIVGGADISGNEWTDEGGGIYSTPMTEDPKWIFIDGVEAKKAETDWITMLSLSGDRQVNIDENDVTGLALVGVEARLKEYSWRMTHKRVVLGYSAGVVTLDKPVNYGFIRNYPIKFIGHKDYFSGNNEWAWHDNKLWIKSSASPSTMTITRGAEAGITIAQGVTGTKIQNINFSQFTSYGVKGYRCNNTTITGCAFSNIRGHGIFFSGYSSGLTVQYCTIINCGTNGIFIGAVQSGEIKHNSITNIGMGNNISWPIDTDFAKDSGCGILMQFDHGETEIAPDDFEIDHNTIHTCGYLGIEVKGGGHVIEKNHIYNVLKKWNDGACIHTFNARYRIGDTNTIITPGIETKQTIIRNNIMHDVEGNMDGIIGGSEITCILYIDNGSVLVSANNNLVYTDNYPVNYGIFQNTDTESNQIKDNIVNVNGTGVYYRRSTADTYVTLGTGSEKNTFIDNIVNTIDESTWAFFQENVQNDEFYNFYKNGGNADRNYYINRYAARYVKIDGTSLVYGVAQLQSRFNTDINSVEKGNDIALYAADDVLLYHNLTDNERQQLIPSGYEDKDGNDISGTTVTIPAWYGYIAFKSS